MQQDTGRQHTLLALLKACAKQKDLYRGSKIHGEIVARGLLEIDPFVGSTLISMYAKCGSIEKAQEVFDELLVQDVVTWNALITGYAQHGSGDQPLKYFGRMQLEGIFPNAATFASIFKACSNIGAVGKGQEIHAYIARRGLVERNVVVSTALVDMYSKYGLLERAQEVFDTLIVRDVVTWSVLIAGYAQHGHGEQALQCFKQIQLEGLLPSIITFACILKACGRAGALGKGQEIHAELSREGLLGKDIALGTALVDMYAKCGSLASAQEVFDKLPFRNVVTWNVLMAAYAQHGLGEQALSCLERMQLEGHSPNAATFACILKACGSIRAADKGQKIHADFIREGLLEIDFVAANALVDMYGKCGLVEKAQEVFEKLPLRDVVLWNALIAGYTQHGHAEQALSCFDKMQLEGFSPDAVTFACILKACGHLGAVNKGQEIHDEIIREGLMAKDILVGNALVDMYAKCGLITRAQEVFEKLPARNIASWNTLIAGYTQHGYFGQVLDCFKAMQLESVSPNEITYTCTLKACGTNRAATKSQEMHIEIVKVGLLENDHVLGNALAITYAKCGLLKEAQDVFDMLLTWSMDSLNALIAGYAQLGHNEQALTSFEQMQQQGFSPNAVTYGCILRACGSIGIADKGQEIHAEIVERGLAEKDIGLGDALVDMYFKCGLVREAQKVFDNLPIRDLTSWNTIIAGYAQYGYSEQALKCYQWMQLEGFSPNTVTFACILKACGSLGMVDKGLVIHAEITQKGLLEKDVVVGNALVGMYSKCGLVSKAQEVFDKLPIWNVVSWNVLIAGFSQHGHGEQALNCFERMLLGGFTPDAVTFSCILKACGRIGAMDKGQEIHAEIVREGLWAKDRVVDSSLIHMYAKCGLVAKAREVFDKLPTRKVDTWNALIAGYAQQGYNESVLKCFDQMHIEGLSPTAVTFACTLKACGSIGAADRGQEIHAEIVREGMQEKFLVGNALVDMYAKCGLAAKAQEVFDKLPVRKIITWNALIAGYGLLGKVEHVFYLFDNMIREEVKPNLVTFTIMLNACSHAGLLDEGQMCFQAISTCYDISTTLEHYTCMVDLFGRAGHLDKAVLVIKEMPFLDDLTVWHTVLSACKTQGIIKLGQTAFQHAMHLDEKDAGAYVCVSNIYADADAALEVDDFKSEDMVLKRQRQPWKKPD